MNKSSNRFLNVKCKQCGKWIEDYMIRPGEEEKRGLCDSCTFNADYDEFFKAAGLIENGRYIGNDLPPAEFQRRYYSTLAKWQQR